MNQHALAPFRADRLQQLICEIAAACLQYAAVVAKMKCAAKALRDQPQISLLAVAGMKARLFLQEEIDYDEKN